MTTIEHTPSPWEDNGNGLIYGQCSGDDDEAPFVADVCTDPNRYTDQEQANARLIVAAPALLAACRMVIDRWERGDLAEAARACQAAVELTTGACPPWEVDGPAIHVNALLAKRREIAVIWSIEDVQSIRPDLNDDQAWEVLQAAKDNHDATIGIHWEVLECNAEMLFGDAPETDHAEEE